MSFEISTISNLPTPVRHKKRALENTVEWQKLRTQIQQGLGVNEVAYIKFTPEEMKKLGIRTAAKVLKDMTAALVKKLDRPYQVWKYTDEQNNTIVACAHPMPNAVGASPEEPQPQLSAAARHHAKEGQRANKRPSRPRRVA